MKIIYIIAYIVAIAVSLVASLKTLKSEKKIAKSMAGLFTCTLSICVFYTIVLLSPDKSIACIAFSFFFISINWVCYYMLKFCREYTDYKPKTTWFMPLVKAIYLFDSASLILNIFYHHMFTTHEVYSVEGEIYYRISNSIFYDLHTDFSYFILALALYILANKVYHASNVYRPRYLSVLVVLVLVCVLDLVYLFTSTPIYLTGIGFIIGVEAIYYITLIYVPRGALEMMLTMVTEDFNDSIMIFDPTNTCLYANHTAKEWAKNQEDGDTLKPFDRWFQAIAHDHPINSSWQATVDVNGVTRYFDIAKNGMYDSHKAFIGCYVHIQDITEETQKLERERYAATHDKLTGLYNKEKFFEKVNEMFKKNPDTEYLMLCSDIGNFKLVNDIFGKECGDAILIRIADALRALCSDRDVYARIQNDKFALLMPKEFFDQRFLEVETAKYTYVAEDAYYPLNVYIGVYEIKNRNIPLSVMYDRANFALVGIKGDFEKRIAFYDDKRREDFINEQEIMGQFDEAIASGQFKMYLQPQVSKEGKVIGGEALVRWIHPQKGLIPPGVFIPVLERSGTIAKLDRYIWEQACKTLRDWQSRGHTNMHISINISPKDFYYADIYEVITSLVNLYKIPTSSLHLEITETSVMNDVPSRVSMINKLKALGFTVEMDDFGSGYSSLNTLKDIPINTMKIDMGFLRQSDNDVRSRKILACMVMLANDLDIDTIVEGVETKEQVEFLTDLGYDVFQGYYFAKPMTVSEFEDKYM